MISMEQLNAILHAQSASTEAMVTRLFEGMASRYAANVPVVVGGGGDGGFGPSGKIFRDIGKFSSEEGAWAEWALKCRITVKECDAGLFKALEMAGDSEVEIDMDEVANSNIMERIMETSAMLYNRHVHLLSGPALALHQSVVGENGLEVWRLLKKRYDPKTTLRNFGPQSKNTMRAFSRLWRWRVIQRLRST